MPSIRSRRLNGWIAMIRYNTQPLSAPSESLGRMCSKII